MIRRLMCLTLAMLHILLTSCSPTKTIRPDQINLKGEKILQVVKTDGTIVTFAEDGGRLDPAREAIVGTVDGKRIAIPVRDVTSLRVDRSDASKTLVVIIAVALLVLVVAGVIAAHTKESCPFVYSFDGKRYVFDAEPLGGAVTKGLERSEYSTLDFLRPVDGTYRLLMRNEVEETQFIDRVSLAVVDHPAGTQVYSDYAGALHTIGSPTPALSARDERGVDLTRLVAAPDDLPWQSKLYGDASDLERPIRHELTLEFPRPAGATEARLVVRAGTALWGSHMIREMLEMRGDGVDAWRRSMDSGGPAMAELYTFMAREELYSLKIQVREGDEWVQRGVILGGGPLISETRVIGMDLSGVTSDRVTLRLSPPVGFWTLDYAAMEYGAHPAPVSFDIPLARAIEPDGRDVTPLLAAVDGTYYEMPVVGDAVRLTFNAPTAPPEGARTILLDTHGYYHIHLEDNRREQKDLIAHLLATDGEIVRYAMRHFEGWSREMEARD